MAGHGAGQTESPASNWQTKQKSSTLQVIKTKDTELAVYSIAAIYLLIMVYNGNIADLIVILTHTDG